MDAVMIDKFQGNYRWLSNFWPARVVYDGFTFRSVEHAYQAAKTLDLVDRVAIQEIANPAHAKTLGRSIQLRSDWEEIKLGIMEQLLRQKFANSILASWLKATEHQVLVEGNTWGDRYWGCVDGEGENHLGKLLMKIRSEL